jgi:amicyanin
MRRILLLAPVLAAVLGLFAPLPASAAGQHVMIAQYAYSSATATVRVGDTITWTNHDDVPHDVVASSGPAAFRSPLLDKGQSWTHTFTSAGTYSYYCSVHPDMRAQVVVLAADTPTQAPAPQQPAPAQRQPVHQPATPTTTAAPTTSAAAPISTPPMQEQQAPTQQAAVLVGKQLDPMLIVAGIVAAVAVLCLLLIGARPQP